MGLKKYEIITVGNNKRVRALRSWQVGDRYVNIGDVGGIVYDEKTLSQDGACWLFRGNFGFPGARIGGDSIVDVGEAALDPSGSPAVDILGSSVVVGGKLSFGSDQTTADAVVLTAADFEQGAFGTYVVGQPLAPVPEANYIRTKNPIFLGGKALTVKVGVPGYSVGAVSVDADGSVIAPAKTVTSGTDVTLTIPAGQYAYIILGKDPVGATVPADATAAQIKFTGRCETKLSVIDSRVEINPATATGVATIKPGGVYAISPGAKYPEAIIRNSKVSMMASATTDRIFRLMGRVIGSTATLDATAGPVVIAGIYSNVKSLTASGVLGSSTGVNAHNLIQATDCDNFAVSPTIFPGLAAARTANMPFIFQGCNVPGGVFYHHVQIANTYKNIDFAKAQADLGKLTVNDYILCSAEVEGMYRCVSKGADIIGALVEAHDSVKFLNMAGATNTYGTTIYKDAYLKGIFEFAGTNVFGNKVRSHPLAQVLNVQPRAVQGTFNTTTIGETITGVTASTTRVCVPIPFRVNGSKGLTMNFPTGFGGAIICTDIKGVITSSTGWVTTETSLSTDVQLRSHFAYVLVGKEGDAAITPADLAGVTVTVYNGCKIVNTGKTAVSMKGNIRVEDNATLVNASVTGSGYFGGNAVMSGMNVNGYAYMKDNTLCTKASENVQTFTGLIMEGNAVYNSKASLALTNLNLSMYDNSKVLGEFRNASVSVTMRDNATITAAGNLSGASTGTVTVQNDAVINTSITVVGDVTLRGSYVSTSDKTWVGKRVIDKHNAPGYDNNVKTQYDF